MLAAGVNVNSVVPAAETLVPNVPRPTEVPTSPNSVSYVSGVVPSSVKSSTAMISVIIYWLFDVSATWATKYATS